MTITLILPVFGAAADFDACLAALKTALPIEFPVLIADDASKDPQIAELARAFAASRAQVEVICRPMNLGFVGNVNLAVQAMSGDFILLNSDTRPTPGFADAMAACAQGDPRIATITPWSNNAEICSWPRMCEVNPWPDEDSATEIAAAAADLRDPPAELPTAVGFCMYVRRRAWDELRGFDESLFGRGYGEENDFCLRAEGHGWRNVLCPQAYVPHRGGASFAAVGLAPGGENLTRLTTRYPGYNERIAEFIMADPLRSLRSALGERVMQRQRDRAQTDPQRRLFD